MMMMMMMIAVVVAATPGDLLPGMRDFAIQLPYSDGNGVAEVGQTKLMSWQRDGIFYTEGDAVVMHTPVDGFHTPNSNYARTEFREKASGTKQSWNMCSGQIHSLKVSAAVMYLPAKSPRVITTQIHDIKTNYPFMIWVDGSSGNNVVYAHFDNKRSSAKQILDANYELGQRFTVVVKTSATTSCSSVKLTVTYTNEATGKTASASNSRWKKGNLRTVYFKAGSYCQSSPKKSGEDKSEFCEVQMYELEVNHNGYRSAVPGVASTEAFNATEVYAAALDEVEGDEFADLVEASSEGGADAVPDDEASSGSSSSAQIIYIGAGAGMVAAAVVGALIYRHRKRRAAATMNHLSTPAPNNVVAAAV
jgi:hypothetical protein